MNITYRLEIDSVKRADTDARAQIDKIAGNGAFALDYKREQIKQLAHEAASAIEAKASAGLERLDAERAQQALKARLSPVPPADQVAQLAYTRDVLAQRWQGKETHQLYADWQEALAAGDVLAARVYGDFLPAHVRQLEGLPAGAELPSIFRDLAQRTTDALMTEEQHQARQAAQDATDAHQELQTTAHGLAQRLRALRVMSDGQLADGERVDMADRIRAQF